MNVIKSFWIYFKILYLIIIKESYILILEILFKLSKIFNVWVKICLF